jgi:hypothetical protein
MRILVEVSEWEQACCGSAFRLGDTVTWTVFAADPASSPTADLPRFVEEHHDQTPEDVPQAEVTGRVLTIAGLRYPELPVPGEPRSFVVDTGRPMSTTLSAVGAGSSGVDDEESATEPFFDYLVELEVADDWVLPEFVVSEATRERERAELRYAEQNRERMHDPVGAVLEAAAQYAEATFGAVASIVRDRTRSAITVEPHRAGATAVRWARSDHESDGIGIHTGDGSWWLPATVENAGLARVFLDAAAAGRVTEEVVDRDADAKRCDTWVRSDDGRRWVSSTDVDLVVGDGDLMIVLGDVWERVQRGNHVYLPWRGRA